MLSFWKYEPQCAYKSYAYKMCSTFSTRGSRKKKINKNSKSMLPFKVTSCKIQRKKINQEFSLITSNHSILKNS